MSDTAFELSTQQRECFTGQKETPLALVRRRFAVRGPLDADALQQRLTHAVARHEVLRTSFVWPTGRLTPLQTVADDRGVVLSRNDAPEDSPSSFAPDAADLVVVELSVAGPDDHVLTLSCAAPVMDGRSLELLAEELLGGETEDEPLQYGDYAAWQDEQREELGLLPPSEGETVALPLAGDPAAASLSLAVAAAPDALRDAGGDPADAWLTLWSIVIARSTGQQRVLVALADHGRSLDEVERAIGPYERSLEVEIDVAPGQSFRQLVSAVRAAREGAESDRERTDPAAGTLLGFAYREPHAVVPVAGVELTLRESVDARAAVQARLEVDGEVRLAVAPAAVNEAEQARLVERIETLAAAAAAEPDADVWSLAMVGAGEQAWLAEAIGSGPQLDAGQPAHRAFEAMAAASPDAPAVRDGDVELTYNALDARANRIAAGLTARGVVPGAVVALLLDRSIEQISAVLGVLKAGGTYLPLNADHPAGRLAFQVQDAGASLVVFDAAAADTAAGLPGEAVAVGELDGEPGQAVDVSAEHVAYIIYTSGSTGQPKGVEVTHGGLANYAAAVASRFAFTDEPLRFGVVGTLSTDLGNTSVFGALTTGGSLELVPAEVATDGVAYADYVTSRGVDVLKITPSHLAALLVSQDLRVLPRRRVILGGEASPWGLIERIRGLRDNCLIANHYGPTETTVGSLTYHVDDRAAAPLAASVPIGRPLANTQLRVADAQGGPVPVGAPGELLIGGAGLARGYCNRDAETSERFVTLGDTRYYRTGDLVRVLSDGNVEFLTRADGQIKIRGYRIELGEIDAALREHPAVEQVAVIAAHDTRNELRIAAYVVPAGGQKLPALREYLLERLPDYMVPAAFIPLESLPLMANGKLDRDALPSPEDVIDDREYVAPSTDTETRVAAIWTTTLNLERVGVTENFFELGGHSLLATQVVARIRQEFGVQLPLQSLFTSPDIVSLAKDVDAAMAPVAAGADDDLASLLDELENLSDEEAERLLREGG